MGAGEEILRRLDAIEAKLDRALAGASSGASHGAPRGASGGVASDSDLDGQYGNPDVKFSPKSWTGPDFAKRPMSQCSADFLDVYAEALQYSSEHPKAGKEKYATYDARDAARARGWARRVREGRGESPAPDGANGSGHSYAGGADDPLPF